MSTDRATGRDGGRVVVASGHMIDAPDRSEPRFPPSAEPHVTRAVREVLDGWRLGPDDLVITLGARGTDLIVAEQALALGVRVVVLLAKEPEAFKAGSVDLPDTEWAQRFDAVLARAGRVEVLPAADTGEKPYARANRWALDRAVAAAAPRPPLVLVVWDGLPGDGGGGTGGFVASARERGLEVTTVAPRPVTGASDVPDPARQAGRRRLLALDGGGMRGLITLKVLRRMEDVLGDGTPGFVLADYFDYIAGTSTGAIIAAGLAMGKPVDTIMKEYVAMAEPVFRRRRLPARLRSLYRRGPLTEQLKQFYGEHTTLGDDRLRTLLLIVLHRADTDSIWPLSNNPLAKYNERGRPDCNLDLPLWQVVRGSAAAPVYFSPESIAVGDRSVLFQDGGVTPFNNPALLLFEMATSRHYRLGWATGSDRLLLVSVGSGFAPAAHADLTRRNVHLFYQVRNLLKVVMNSSAVENDRLCRVLGDTRWGPPVDSEFDSPATEPVATPLFSYVRYTVDLSERGLDRLGLPRPVDARKVGALDSWRAVEDLQMIGERVARDVRAEHFAGFPRRPATR